MQSQVFAVIFFISLCRSEFKAMVKLIKITQELIGSNDKLEVEGLYVHALPVNHFLSWLLFNNNKFPLLL